MAKSLKYVKVLSILGMFLASYLMYLYIVRPAFSPCSISSTVNCDAATKGEISTFLGIPVALVGLIGYIVIFISATLKKVNLALGMTVFGVLFCLRLIFIEVFILQVICPICVMCMLVMLSILFILVKLKITSSKLTKSEPNL